MSRILFAWELGAGFGHLGPFRPVAQALSARGHEITLAVRDVERANIAFRDLPVRIVQAPLCAKTYGGLAEPPLNYAEILMRYGYLDSPLLAGMLRAWRSLLDITRPDVLVVDHAPTALLAARGTERPRILFGSAFPVPPTTNPTPNMRPWVSVPQERLASSDASVLDVVGVSLSPEIPKPGALHELFDGAERLLVGTPELDPYGPRNPEHYLGLYASSFGATRPRWPEGGGPRVFAYLNADYRHIEPALAALGGGTARSLVYLLGGPAALRQKYQNSRLAFSDALVDLEAVLDESDFCVCHGNSGTLMSMLRAGKPMLLLPAQLEHFLLSSNVERLGIARVLRPEMQPQEIAGVLARALGEASMAGAARAFALRHREPSVDTIVKRVAGRIESLALGRGGKRA